MRRSATKSKPPKVRLHRRTAQQANEIAARIGGATAGDVIGEALDFYLACMAAVAATGDHHGVDMTAERLFEAVRDLGRDKSSRILDADGEPIRA